MNKVTISSVEGTDNCCVSVCFQMFLTVYLSNNEQHFTEVPVTPETVCRDVVDLCKEPGESDCHLAEVWCGSGERPRPPCALVLASFLTAGLQTRSCVMLVFIHRETRLACPSGDGVLDPALP